MYVHRGGVWVWTHQRYIGEGMASGMGGCG